MEWRRQNTRKVGSSCAKRQYIGRCSCPCKQKAHNSKYVENMFLSLWGTGVKTPLLRFVLGFRRDRSNGTGDIAPMEGSLAGAQQAHQEIESFRLPKTYGLRSFVVACLAQFLPPEKPAFSVHAVLSQQGAGLKIKQKLQVSAGAQWSPGSQKC